MHTGIRYSLDGTELSAEHIHSEVTPFAPSAPQLPGPISETASLSAEFALETNGLEAPTLTTTAYSELTPEEFDTTGPGWKLDSGYDVTGNFEIHFLEADVNGWQAPVFSEILSGLDSRFASPESTRWGAGYYNQDSTSSLDDGFVLALASGDVVQGGHGGAGGYVSWLNGQGELIWFKNWDTSPFAAVENADGTVTLAGGDGRGLWIAATDRSGDVLWSEGHTLDFNLQRTELVAAGSGDDSSFYYVVGYIDRGADHPEQSRCVEIRWNRKSPVGTALRFRRRRRGPFRDPVP